MKKYELIDFLKGFAIFTIVIYHALQRVDLNPMMQNAIKLGGTGVHLFLLISGLGLYLSHQRKALSFPALKKKTIFKNLSASYFNCNYFCFTWAYLAFI